MFLRAGVWGFQASGVNRSSRLRDRWRLWALQAYLLFVFGVCFLLFMLHRFFNAVGSEVFPSLNPKP